MSAEETTEEKILLAAEESFITEGFEGVYSGERRPPIPVQRRPVGFVVF